MSEYLDAKFQVSGITLTSFRLGVILLPPQKKQTPKKPTQIRVYKYLTFNKNHKKHFREVPLKQFANTFFCGRELKK